MAWGMVGWPWWASAGREGEERWAINGPKQGKLPFFLSKVFSISVFFSKILCYFIKEFADSKLFMET
jgi:hypothetical protein